MRKGTSAIIGAVLVASAVASPAQAQIGFGPVIGISLANIGGADRDSILPGRKSRTGLVAGLVLDFPISRMFSIRPEVLYVRRASRSPVACLSLPPIRPFIRYSTPIPSRRPKACRWPWAGFAVPAVTSRAGCWPSTRTACAAIPNA